MVLNKWLLFVGVLAIFTNVSANTKHCSLIEPNDERLACYAKTSHDKPRDWAVLKSKYFDSITVSRRSNYAVLCGDRTETMTMVLVCAEKQTSLYISGSCLFGETGDVQEVPFQVDDQEPVTSLLAVPNNKYVLTLKDESDAKNLIMKMLEGNQLHIKMPAISSQPFTASFDVSNLTEHIDDFNAACK